MKIIFDMAHTATEVRQSHRSKTKTLSQKSIFLVLLKRVYRDFGTTYNWQKVHKII